MKKYLSIIIVIAMVISIFSGYPKVAKAAGVEVKITPGSVAMTAAGDTTLQVTVSNNTDTEIAEGAVLKREANGHQCGTAFGKIVPGDHGDMSFGITVTDAMFGTQETFQLYQADGVTKIDGASAKVSFVLNQTVSLGATFEVSPSELVAEGDKIKLIVKVENKGNVSLKNIAVKLDGKMIHESEFTLAPLETKTVEYIYTVSKAALLAPVVYYKVNGTGDTQKYDQITPIQLVIESRKVDMTLTADPTNPQAGQDVTLKVAVTNNGNVPYKNLKAYINGELVDFPSSTLAPGKTYNTTYTRSYTASMEVVFLLTLEDNKGETVNVDESVLIELPVDDSEIASKLKMNMEVDRPTLTSGGTVTFTGNIVNGTNYTLKNLVVTETSQNKEVYSAALLESYMSTSFLYTIDVSETGTYSFQLTVQDTAGATHTITSEPITVTITSAALPSSSASGSAEVSPTDGTGESKSSGLKAIVIIAIILVVLIIGVGVALLLLWKAQKSGGVISRGSATKTGVPKAGASKTGASNSGVPKKKPSVGPMKRKKPVSRGYRDRNNF